MNEKICKTCVWFTSYRVDYEDPLEPDDCGFCKEEHNFMEHTSEDDTCDNHTEYVVGVDVGLGKDFSAESTVVMKNGEVVDVVFTRIITEKPELLEKGELNES